jgi:2-C-methyl-D-erythritol 4-phosphate cytidylyltransferase
MSAALWFVVPAAGSARRMGGELPKQYLEIAGRTLLEHALAPLVAHARIAGGVVATAADDARFDALPPALRARLMRCTGGAERADSVRAALERLGSVAGPDDWVLVHDAARPCLAAADLDRLIDACCGDEVGGLLAVPVADTLKRADAGERVAATVAREGLWRAQTPQMFRLRLLVRALDTCAGRGIVPTDEAAAVESLGLRPRLVRGSPHNIKVTEPGDLDIAARWLAARPKVRSPGAGAAGGERGK